MSPAEPEVMPASFVRNQVRLLPSPEDQAARSEPGQKLSRSQ